MEHLLFELMPGDAQIMLRKIDGQTFTDIVAGDVVLRFANVTSAVDTMPLDVVGGEFSTRANRFFRDLSASEVSIVGDADGGETVQIGKARLSPGKCDLGCHELFFDGEQLTGQLILRHVGGDFRAEFSKSFIPRVLQSESIAKRAVPTEVVSWLPISVADALPLRYRYWLAKSIDDAVTMRDALAAAFAADGVKLAAVGSSIMPVASRSYVVDFADENVDDTSSAIAKILPSASVCVHPFLIGDEWEKAAADARNNPAMLMVLSPTTTECSVTKMADVVTGARSQWLIDVDDSVDARDELAKVGRPFRVLGVSGRIFAASFAVPESLVDWLDTDIAKAVWTSAFINDLPDKSFLYIEPGGKKDDDGKTVPRRLRHFPVLDANGEIDLPHLRNAIARIPQSTLPAGVKREAQERARRMLEEENERLVEQEKTERAGTEKVEVINKRYEPIFKGTDEQFVLGVVLEPEPFDGRGDSQGDTYSKDEVRKAAHRFLAQYRKVGLMHEQEITGEANVVQSFVVPDEMDGMKIHDVELKQGTWLLGVHVPNEKVWKRVRDGDLTGFSIGGSAVRSKT